MRVADMADKEITTPTLQLIDDLIRQFRQLVSSEINLVKSELAHSAGSLASGVIALAAGGAIMFAGLIILLVAASFLLMRLRARRRLSHSGAGLSARRLASGQVGGEGDEARPHLAKPQHRSGFVASGE